MLFVVMSLSQYIRHYDGALLPGAICLVARFDWNRRSAPSRLIFRGKERTVGSDPPS